MDKQGRKFSDGELRDELITLIVAGFETSFTRATTLPWRVFFFPRNESAFGFIVATLSHVTC
jgi:cytochrome P450